MTIPLNQFEQFIDETILKRGFSYFNNGYIQEVSEISEGQYEAIVSGTEEYTVHIKTENNLIIEQNCDCPYDLGPVCKHVVAVIFYLQKDLLELKGKQPKKPKNKSVAQQVKELLNSISHEELMEFIRENAKKDREFRNYFLASFAHLGEDNSKGFYQKQISAILKSAAGRDGFIYWNQMKNMVRSIMPFLENAQKSYGNEDFRNVFYISSALLEEMTEALDYGDDSNGDLGYFINFSVEMLYNLASRELPQKIKKELFEFCLGAFEKKLFKGWDWHLDMLSISSRLIENKNEAQKVLKLLDNVNNKYSQNLAESLQLDIIRRFHGEIPANDFIEKHISNPIIRREQIENTLKNHEFEKAVKLCKEGITHDETNYPGLAKEWHDWLLKIAQARVDKPKIIEYARFLLLDSFMPQQNYYQILKSTVAPQEWTSFVEGIITEITPHSRWTYVPLIRKIYIEEEWWDRLFSLVKQNLSLNTLEENEKYLSADYSQELINLYSERISNYVKKFVGRKYYKAACRYLRRMKKLGGGDQVELLIGTLRKEYPQRRALLDELNKV